MKRKIPLKMEENLTERLKNYGTDVSTRYGPCLVMTQYGRIVLGTATWSSTPLTSASLKNANCCPSNRFLEISPAEW